MGMTDANHAVRTRVSEIAPGVYYVPTLMSNVYFIGSPEGPWILVDSGVPGSASRIRAAAESVYGSREPDPPDPTVGGFMAQMSRLFPHKGTNTRHRLRPLPMDFSVPYAHGWRFIHMPGHTPGHVSLFRDADRVPIAGDALISVDQQQAHDSVLRLADPRPRTVSRGHGLWVSGEDVAPALVSLAESFWSRAPRQGRYVQTRGPAGGGTKSAAGARANNVNCCNALQSVAVHLVRPRVRCC